MIITFMKAGVENILYYNAIADEYNDMLDKNPDRVIREKVAKKFCEIVEGASVLDFGGGTGLDLQWLANRNHMVFFCEPSIHMREKAIYSRANFLHDNVIFLDDSAADFRQWQLQPPFSVKVDAVLANFAVLNCIGDIEFLFQSLAAVVKPGGDVIALVLTKTLAILKKNFSSVFKSLIHREPVTIHLSYKRNRQTVYIYSVREIRKASKEYFKYCSNEVLTRSGFTLLHLKRNEKLL